jgi:hypothetical protein
MSAKRNPRVGGAGAQEGFKSSDDGREPKLNRRRTLAPFRTTKEGYGIIAYAARGDETHFDGWYYVKELAEAAFEHFKQRYPHAFVHMVVSVRSEWRRS